MSNTDERRLRRRAQRAGLLLVKSRADRPDTEGRGLYVLVTDTRGNRVGRYGGQAAVSEFAKGYGLTLDGVERELSLLA
ncbi:hypothetical protein [Mycolicibacterium septicum]|uniref:hypothetical protein n=1 Tax=Mycolicibacterium septicum TaxID=98668 RepID=UPI001AF36374|nr:hypothetical protein [Mycolicibacterium septicum]QRY53393.1 hypothetical protein JVX95_08770 [Mycolicibacterium septicum]